MIKKVTFKGVKMPKKKLINHNTKINRLRRMDKKLLKGNGLNNYA